MRQSGRSYIVEVRESGKASCNRLEWREDARGPSTLMNPFVGVRTLDFQLGPGSFSFDRGCNFRISNAPMTEGCVIRGDKATCELQEILSETLRRLKQIH